MFHIKITVISDELCATYVENIAPARHEEGCFEKPEADEGQKENQHLDLVHCHFTQLY
jgi:hypothetical protein